MFKRLTSPAAACLAAGALFGAATPLSKGLMDGSLDPTTLAGLLYLGAALGCAPAAWASQTPLSAASPRSKRRVAAAVVMGGVLGPLLLLHGLSRAPAGSAALWLSLETPATLLLGVLFFREHAQREAWIAAALIVAGSLWLAAPDGHLVFAPAAGLIGLACLCWGIDNHVTAVVDDLSPAQTTFIKGLGAGSFSLILGLLSAPAPSPTVALSGLVLGVFSYGLSIVLYIHGAQHLGASRAQMLFSSAPLWGVLLAWGWLGERPGLHHLGAGVLMAGALWLLQRERHEHPHTHEAMEHAHWHRHDDGHHTHHHDVLPPGGWHSHPHRHDPITHTHPHRPDLHHRHGHDAEPRIEHS
jgi:drug/metabolite transporter (DMT)-like permease